MPKKVAVMLDGGHLRALAKKARRTYDPNYIEKIGLACAKAGDEVYRILYYDCPPYTGEVTLPVSGTKKILSGSSLWLEQLSHKDFFAVRRGTLKFRGFVPKRVLSSGAPTDGDFKAQFEQKGVDMRIGLDMAIFAEHRSVDLIALATNDTDCIPAMKHARRSGVQVALVVVPNYTPAPDLLSHSDFQYKIAWP